MNPPVKARGICETRYLVSVRPPCARGRPGWRSHRRSCNDAVPRRRESGALSVRVPDAVGMTQCCPEHFQTELTLVHEESATRMHHGVLRVVSLRAVSIGDAVEPAVVAAPAVGAPGAMAPGAIAPAVLVVAPAVPVPLAPIAPLALSTASCLLPPHPATLAAATTIHSIFMRKLPG